MNRFTKTFAAACVLAVAAPFASAATAADTAYQKERAACLNGSNQQDRQTCLKEAGAAREESRKGRLDNRDQAATAQNATQRCTALPAGERALCERRVKGEGKVSGSVASGGRMTELTVQEPASPASGAAK